MKPRVYWTYYPKLKRGFWRVAPTTKFVRWYHDPKLKALWEAAYAAVAKVNAANDPPEPAEDRGNK